MISFEEARRIILEHAQPLGVVRRSLENSLGSVLAESISAGLDLPRFDNSSVDGYGVKVSDIQQASTDHPVNLKWVGLIQAGDDGKIQVKAGETVQIFTGAPIPASVEAVVMQEFTQTQGEHIGFFTAAEVGENIRPKGEEFKRGQTVIQTGIPITPPVIGLLATLGQVSAKVYRKPKVGVITTGNELVQPGKKLTKRGQIYDANTAALSAALKATGIEKIRAYQVRDDQKATRRIFEKALAENDVVISLGGVSVGAFDFIKDVAEEIGVQTLFWRIAMKPGKPVYFGKSGKKLVFGLPGNPVSALVTYHQLVQPALKNMMGYPIEKPSDFRAQLSKPLRKRAGRQEFVRGVVTCNGTFKVEPTRGQDSHMLGGLAAANCLIDFPSDAEDLSENAWVDVDWLSWSLNAR